MRTIVSIPDTQLRKLDRIARRQSLPRTELIRRAVADYTQRHDAPPDVFGIWREQAVDGLQMQETLRAEWDREWDR